MATPRPRSEAVIAVGLVAFIAIAFLKPWGSTPPSPDPAPSATAETSTTSTTGPTPPAIAEGFGRISTSIPMTVTPVGPAEVRGDLWFPADGAHVIKVDTRTSTTTEIALDPTRFSGTVELAGDSATLWVTGADDHSVGVLETASLEVSRIPSFTTEPMVIDRIHGATAHSGYVWFLADVHASQEILGAPCCNGFTATVLYRADVSGFVTRIRQLDRPVALGIGFGSVWVLAQPSGPAGPYVLDRLDWNTGTIRTTIALPADGPTDSSCGACISSFRVGTKSVWVPTGLANSLLRVDPTVDRVVDTIHLGRAVESAVETPDGYIWIAGGRRPGVVCDPAAGYVSVIDASTNRVVRDSSIACPVSLVVDGGDVWVGTDDPTGPAVKRLQPPP